MMGWFEKAGERLADIIAWVLNMQGAKFTYPHCTLEDPVLIREMTKSNFSIGVVFILLSVGAIERIFHYKNRIDNQQKAFLILFASFVSCCGMTHWMRVFTLWYSGFIYESYVLDICEYVSWITLFVMIIIEYRKRHEPTKKEFHELAQQIRQTGEEHGIKDDS